MSEISKKEMQSIKDGVVDLIQAQLGSKYLVTVASAKYGYIGKLTLEFSKADADGNLETKMAKDFRYSAVAYGLEPDDLGARYTSFSGSVLEIVGLKPRNRKYPIIVRNINTDQRFKVSELEVQRMKKLGGKFWHPAS